MEDFARPISESYWVETGRLLAGEYPGRYEAEQTRRRLDALLEAGFDTFIDLTNPDETFPYVDILLEAAHAYEIEAAHHRFPIGDFGLPTPGLMNALLDLIDDDLRDGRKIYLHCWGGIGRTGTTIGCYLVRRGRSAEEALHQLAAWWQGVPKSRYYPYSPETREQVNFIRAWVAQDDRLRKRRS